MIRERQLPNGATSIFSQPEDGDTAIAAPTQAPTQPASPGPVTEAAPAPRNSPDADTPGNTSPADKSGDPDGNDAPDDAPDAKAADAPAQPDVPDTINFYLSVLDMAGQPIPDLKYRVIVGKDTYNGTTDSKGIAPAITGLKPNEPLEILIRKTNGEYASKYTGYTQCSDMSVCAVSPHVKISLETEPHEGEPAPAPAPTTPPTAAPTQAPAPAAAPAQAAAPQGKGPAAPAAGQIAGNSKPPSKDTQECRDQAGRPRLTFKERALDWMKRHWMPTLVLWSPKDFAPGAKGCTTPAVGDQAKSTGSAAGPKSPPATAAAAPGPSVKVSSLDQPPPPAVKKLIDIMEEQATWEWKEIFEIDRYHSASIKAAIVSNTFKPRTGKAPGKSVGRCYASVKIGLWRAGLVSGFMEDIPAKGAGPWLLQQGFVDVTASVPDARWALPGDVIVYRYSDKKQETNRKATESARQKYEKEKAAYDLKQAAHAKEVSLWEAVMKERKLAKEEAKKNKKKYADGPDPKRPELGREPQPPDDRNYGHIDVRTYDGYISDFKRTTSPDATELVVSGIYRKVYDPLPDLRLRAFLKIIREWECHSEPVDEKRYYLTNSFITDPRHFSDTKSHPFETIADKRNTPAGAYQINLIAYNDYTSAKFGIGSGFSPAKQDRITVALLEAKKNALGAIRSGDISSAVASLLKTWTSLPGAKEPRKEKINGAYKVFDMTDLQKRYEQFLTEQLKK